MFYFGRKHGGSAEKSRDFFDRPVITAVPPESSFNPVKIKIIPCIMWSVGIGLLVL